MEIKQKNCVFESECPFLMKCYNEVKCMHPKDSLGRTAYYISVLFERCPLKIEELVLKLVKEKESE